MTVLRQVVADTGPLITLERLTGGYDLIRALYDQIIVPEAVLQELTIGSFPSQQAYLAQYGLLELFVIQRPTVRTKLPQQERLHAGEIGALRLAIEHHLPLLIEESAGRDSARLLGIEFSGIAGQILRAHRTGVVTAATALVMTDELLQHGRINRRLYQAMREVL